MAQTFSYSRRLFLAGGLVLAGAGGGLVLVEKGGDRQRRQLGHRAGAPGGDVPSPEIITTLTSYLGAYFGRDFTVQDIRELADRMLFAATRDSGWTEEYEAAASLLDREAAGHGFAEYTSADRETQVAVIRDLRQPLRGPLAGIRFGTSDSLRIRERMRRSTSRHLIRLYRRSGVPWRQRGFTTWPGVPDQVAAYDRLLQG